MKLRQLSNPPLPTPNPVTSLTEKPLVGKRLGGLSLPTLQKGSLSRPLTPLQAPTSSAHRVLDFDVETLAAGFADPAWVPQKITCCAWSWVGSDEVKATICGPMGFFKPELRRKMLLPLLEAISEATMVTGHNLLRFDLPVINSECLRLGLPTLGAVLVQDTIRLKRTKGFKKGQDNLGRLLKTLQQKESMDWQAWEEAYEEDGWPLVESRAKTDVIQHKQIREQMLERDWLKPPTLWRP